MNITKITEMQPKDSFLFTRLFMHMHKCVLVVENLVFINNPIAGEHNTYDENKRIKNHESHTHTHAKKQVLYPL